MKMLKTRNFGHQVNTNYERNRTKFREVLYMKEKRRFQN